MHTPNAQTPGPVAVCPSVGVPGWEDAVCTLRSSAGYVGEVDNGNTPAEAKANARLLAAAYTMADRAGRELGIDAAQLCESLDLAALIRLAQKVESGGRVLSDMAANISDAPHMPTVEAVRGMLRDMGEQAADALPFMGRGPHGDLILGRPAQAARTR